MQDKDFPLVPKENSKRFESMACSVTSEAPVMSNKVQPWIFLSFSIRLAYNGR